jgi:hypothetical protein
MNLKLEKIIIVKKGLTGEVCVRYNLFSINKIIVDLNSAVDTFKIAKYENTAIITGQLINDLKEQVFDFFQENLGEAPDGIYEIIPELEYTINKM